KRLRDKIEEIRWEDAADPSRWVKFARGQVRLCFYILRELIRNRCPQQAAALTFTTLLSLVPLFAVAFSFFRGFAALEGVSARAQDAIFRTVLTGPLLDGGPGAESTRGQRVQDMPALASVTPEELVAEADRRPRTVGVGPTLYLYVRALNAGAEPAVVRRGISTLHLAAAPSLRQPFGLMQPEVQQAYFGTAEFDVGPAAKPGPRREEAAEHYAQGRRFARDGRYPEAIEALTLAEEAGYSLQSTREAAAGVHEALADGLVRQEELEEATGHYRSSLLDYSDAIVLAARSLEDEDVADLAKRHDQALKKLGGALLDLGTSRAATYDRLARAEGEAAHEALQAALKDLNEAAALLEHSSAVHAELGELYSKAGRHEEEAREFRIAWEKSREVAARGISVAVVDYIQMFIDKVGRAEIGILGILILLVTATSLLSTIERTLNHIWKVTEHRPFWIKFTSFCTLIWLGPALIGASLWVRERLGDYITKWLGDVAFVGSMVDLLTRAGEQLLPFVTTWLVLVALYKFLPHTRVRFTSVAWGACLAAILLHGARPLFSIYVIKAVRYEKIYGSLGAIPIFLLWVWLLWLIVLFGAEVSFTIQNVGLLRYRDRLHRLSEVFIDRYLAARIMMYVAREFWETGQAVTARRLSEILQMTPEEASDAAGRLVRLGLLTPVGEQRDEFHPARDLSKLKLSEVLSITDRFRDESRSARAEDRMYEDKLESAFRSAIQAQDEALSNLTLRDLLKECENDRNKWPQRNASQGQ
ncbi:MAG: YihY/virulence factor BrkB family protein, partial [Planctomycetota bacterium]